jgi:Glycolipid 2-alpha-mannosyltransferase
MLDPAASTNTPSRTNWQGEKPKPNYAGRWLPAIPVRLRLLRALPLFIFVICSITIYVLLLPKGEPEHDIVKATKEYNEYLASPRHQALIYPEESDRAHGKAAIIALVRNSELDDMMQSMRELEQTFNRKFKYPWIFFNDEPFTDKFKRITSSLTDAETHYGNASVSCI